MSDYQTTRQPQQANDWYVRSVSVAVIQLIIAALVLGIVSLLQ